MKNEIIKYAQAMNVEQDVFDWLNKHVFEKAETTQTELEHIIDYMASDKRPKRLTRMSFNQAKKNTEKWNSALVKKGSHIQESESDIEVIKDFGDGFKIVRLVGENAYKREGYLMRHCVATYYGRSEKIYSLRDADNMPHCTMEYGQQIKGKGNGAINPKYVGYIVTFLEEVGMTVGDNEMRNLGYINVEKITKKIKTDNLFNKKYWYENDVILDKNGQEYIDFDLWDYKPVVSVCGDFDIKINFDLSSFIKKAIEKLPKKKGSSGDRAQIGSSGNYAQIGSSGFAAQIGSSGNAAQIGSSGFGAQIGSSGDRAKIGSSGDRAQIGSSGNYAQIGSSGNRAQIGSSGDRAQIGSSGDRAQIGSSGDRAQIGSSGDRAQIEVEGINSIASSVGINGRIKASLGTPVAIAEYDSDYNPIRFVCGVVGQDGIKPDTWYCAKDGKLVEVE